VTASLTQGNGAKRIAGVAGRGGRAPHAARVPRIVRGGSAKPEGAKPLPPYINGVLGSDLRG